MKRDKKTTKKIDNKIILILFILLISIGVIFSLKIALNSNRPSYFSKNIYVYNITDDKMELGIREDEKVPPASLTKMMTVLVALENINDLSTIAPVDVDSYKEMVSRNSSMAGFFGKETTTYRDLLYGTMLASGGEAANSLAINIAGSKEEFVNLMNIKKEELELKNTNFRNPDGLDEENHYSSAKDLGKILNYALKDGDFRAIFTKNSYQSTSTLDHPKGLLINSTVLSKLPHYTQEGFEIIGGKSGTTINAGHCWATLVKKNEKEYICIVLGSDYYGEVQDGHIIDTLEIMKNI